MKSSIPALLAGLCMIAAASSLRADAPTDITLSANQLLEWAPANTVIGTFTAVDADVGDTHGFALVDGEGSVNNNGFVIVGNQLRSQYPADVDYEENPLVLSIRVRVTDSTFQSFEKVLSVEIADDRNEDVDGDGLTEAEEEDIYGTSDVVFDSDGDGVGDGAEVAAGSLPADAGIWPGTSIVGWGSSANGVQSGVSGGGVIDLKTGENHSMALKANGEVTGWGGYDSFGQLEVPADLADVVAVAAGGDYWVPDSAHSLALKHDGTVRGWGYNLQGKIIVPAGLNQVVSISAGRSHCIALKSDGTVVTWGNNPHGTIEPPVGLGGVVAVSAGGFHSLALKSDGTVVAWGSNFDGINWQDVTVPAGLADVTAISAGRFHSLALRSDGTVVAWGYNLNGQTTVPAGLTDVVAVSAGGFHSMALKSDGSVVTWGSNSHGQSTVPPAAASGVKAISAGILHSLAVLQDTGYPSITSSAVIQGVPGGAISHQVLVSNATPQVFSASGLPAGLEIDSQTGLISGSSGPARCTAVIRVETDQGELTQNLWIGISEGLPPDSIVLAPAELMENSPAGTVAGVLTATDPDEGDTHTFELVDGPGNTDNGLFGVSGNQLILNATLARDFETNPAGFSIRVRARDASLNPFEQVLAISFTDDRNEDIDGDGLTEAEEEDVHLTSDTNPDSDGDGFGDGYEVSVGTEPADGGDVPSGRLLVTWGGGDQGQTAQPGPVNELIALSAGGRHNLALNSDGTVVAWGADDAGQSDVPPGLAGVIAVSAGRDHSLALRSDGTIVAWGDNTFGQCDVPVDLTDVVAISAGACHNLALKADGTVVAWGYNDYGQSDVPAGLSDVVAVAAGGVHSMALKSDGSVVVWGSDWEGLTTVPAGLTGVTAIAAGGYHCMALRYDGTVVSWGTNVLGVSSVPDGLSGVTAIAAGWVHSLALLEDGALVSWGDDAVGQTTIPMEAVDIRLVDAGDGHNIAIRQDSGFPTMADVSPVRAMQGETVTRQMFMTHASTTSWSAMGMPSGLAIDPQSGLVDGFVTTGERKTVRISAVTDQGEFSSTVWMNTADGLPPTDIQLSASTVVENSPAGTIIGNLSVVDPNPGDSHTLVVEADPEVPDGLFFTVVGGQLVVGFPLAVNYDAGISQLVVRVVAVDAAGNPFAKDLVLQLTDDRTEDADGDGLDEAFEEDVLGTSDSVADDFNVADADHDGVPSLLEYAFNLEPKVPSPPVRLIAGAGGMAGLPAVDFVDDGEGGVRIRMEYIRRIGSMLTYTPQFSATLEQGWETAVPVVTPIDAWWERCVVEDPHGTGDAERRFGRIAVSW